MEFLTKKWAKENGYRLRKELFAFTDNKIAVQVRFMFRRRRTRVADACMSLYNSSGTSGMTPRPMAPSSGTARTVSRYALSPRCLRIRVLTRPHRRTGPTPRTASCASAR